MSLQKYIVIHLIHMNNFKKACQLPLSSQLHLLYLRQ